MKAKLVSESISFERGGDPKSILGIGIKFDSSQDAAEYVNDNFLEITGFEEMKCNPKDDEQMHPRIYKKLEKWYRENKHLIDPEEESEEDFWDGFVDWDACY